jgi:hypothetical protein
VWTKFQFKTLESRLFFEDLGTGTLFKNESQGSKIFGFRLDQCGSTKVSVAVLCEYANELRIVQNLGTLINLSTVSFSKGLWPVELHIYTHVEVYTCFCKQLHLVTNVPHFSKLGEKVWSVKGFDNDCTPGLLTVHR